MIKIHDKHLNPPVTSWSPNVLKTHLHEGSNVEYVCFAFLVHFLNLTLLNEYVIWEDYL